MSITSLVTYVADTYAHPGYPSQHGQIRTAEYDQPDDAGRAAHAALFGADGPLRHISCLECCDTVYYRIDDGPWLTTREPCPEPVTADDTYLGALLEKVRALYIAEPPAPDNLDAFDNDTMCGDCWEGRCHWGGVRSRASEAAARRGEVYVDPAGYRCGCARHEISVRGRAGGAR